jgi:hypothetical protein
MPTAKTNRPSPTAKTNRPSPAEIKGASKLQAPKGQNNKPGNRQNAKPSNRRVVQLAGLVGPSGEKWRMSELTGREFTVTSVTERTTQNGDAYIFNIIVDGDKAHFWAPVDASRTELVGLIRDALQEGADEVGPFTIEEQEPTRRGFSGYCRITPVGGNDEVPF